MQESLSCWTVIELYEEYVIATHSPQKAQRIINELRTTLLRYWAEELGFKRTSVGRKITKVDSTEAQQFLQTLGVEVLLNARQTLQQAFETQKASMASRHTYGNRMDHLLSWSQEQECWPDQSSWKAKVKAQCCPMLKNPYGHTSNTPLTERRTRYLNYGLKPQKTPVALQQELDQFFQFLTSPEWPSRVIDPIEDSSAREYIKDTRLILGWFYQYQTPPVELEQLSLSQLFPLVTSDDLEGLTIRQQEKLWKQHKQTLETWLCGYFSFLREVIHSKSPQTRHNKLGALLALAKFLYTGEVETIGDYKQIPLVKVLTNHLAFVRKEIAEWTKNRQSVSDFEKKWPDTPEGKTALAVVRAKIVEPLRIECRPRNSRGLFRGGAVIARSHQYYLKWSFLADLPPRRQQEYRTARIALTCPITRPEGVPLLGLYHPLPPDEVREKRRDGTIKDNYFYFTYVHKKKHYPQGVWVLEVQEYKTRKTYGAQSIVIPNRQLADGSCFYNYLERYLYGWFLPAGYTNARIYDWWQPELIGCRGRWVTTGRACFNPGDACCLPTGNNAALWSWGYLLVAPHLGILADEPGFAGSFDKTSHRLIGKRITPHTMRYIWATWAYQVQLNDAKFRSLAYAMGHKVETLRQMYERCTPEEKRRPIEEAIDELLFDQLPEPALDVETLPHFQGLLQQLQQLSPTELMQLMAALAR
jgi:hypothetical protein